MKWLLIAAFVLGCAGREVRDELVERMFLVVENNNWAQATVYLTPGYNSSMKSYVGKVNGLGERRFELRRSLREFRVYVEFIANGDAPWLDEQVWYDNDGCVRVRIGPLSQFTYSVPC